MPYKDPKKEQRCPDCGHVVRRDSLVRHKRLYCRGFVSVTAPPPTVVGLSTPTTVGHSIRNVVEFSATTTVPTQSDGGVGNQPIALEEQLFGAALNWCSEPSTGDVKRATIGVLRQLHAYSRPELHQYLTKYHPSIPVYSQAMLITAATTAARHVASKFHIFDAGHGSSDPEAANDATKARIWIARWGAGLRVPDPVTPPHPSNLSLPPFVPPATTHPSAVPENLLRTHVVPVPLPSTNTTEATARPSISNVHTVALSNPLLASDVTLGQFDWASEVTTITSGPDVSMSLVTDAPESRSAMELPVLQQGEAADATACPHAIVEPSTAAPPTVINTLSDMPLVVLASPHASIDGDVADGLAGVSDQGRPSDPVDINAVSVDGHGVQKLGAPERILEESRNISPRKSSGAGRSTTASAADVGQSHRHRPSSKVVVLAAPTGNSVDHHGHSSRVSDDYERFASSRRERDRDRRRCPDVEGYQPPLPKRLPLPFRQPLRERQNIMMERYRGRCTSPWRLQPGVSPYSPTNFRRNDSRVHVTSRRRISSGRRYVISENERRNTYQR